VARGRVCRRCRPVRCSWKPALRANGIARADWHRLECTLETCPSSAWILFIVSRRPRIACDCGRAGEEISRHRDGWQSRRRPLRPGPWTMLNTPAGIRPRAALGLPPASGSRSSHFGLTTAVQPAAMRQASLPANEARHACSTALMETGTPKGSIITLGRADATRKAIVVCTENLNPKLFDDEAAKIGVANL